MNLSETVISCNTLFEIVMYSILKETLCKCILNTYTPCDVILEIFELEDLHPDKAAALSSFCILDNHLFKIKKRY